MSTSLQVLGYAILLSDMWNNSASTATVYFHQVNVFILFGVRGTLHAKSFYLINNTTKDMYNYFSGRNDSVANEELGKAEPSLGGSLSRDALISFHTVIVSELTRLITKVRRFRGWLIDS